MKVRLISIILPLDAAKKIVGKIEQSTALKEQRPEARHKGLKQGTKARSKAQKARSKARRSEANHKGPKQNEKIVDATAGESWLLGTTPKTL